MQGVSPIGLVAFCVGLCVCVCIGTVRWPDLMGISLHIPFALSLSREPEVLMGEGVAEDRSNPGGREGGRLTSETQPGHTHTAVHSCEDRLSRVSSTHVHKLWLL